MAIVSLGTIVLTGTSTPQRFSPFLVRDSQAYQVIFEIAVQEPNLLFSDLLISPFLELDSGRDFYYHKQFLLNPFFSPRSILLPLTPIYDSDGICRIEADRRNIIRTGGDGGVITVTATYDDNADIRTWLR